MKQLTQKLKKGDIEIREVPMPAVPQGSVLVRNHYSLISAGTEGSTVATARKSLIGKARARPQQAKQVLEVLQTQGVVQTYRAVMKKLDAYSPLGYSCAGEVIGVGEGVSGFRVGDRVACAGNSASHAEIVSIPENLAVLLAPDADLKQAAYNALGSIAMQGVRRAGLALGETCAIIGLGLIGQVTGLMLRASGVKVLGIDVDANAVEAAKGFACDHAWTRNSKGLADEILRMSDGLGVDAVIIAAGTSSLDPINFAGEICRKRGKVVIVGAVPTGFERDPHYYRKELDILMSCSYGPGRYDIAYEEKGIDYPAAYVRWTEKRNMASFQSLLQSGLIDLEKLTTHVFEFEKAADAYELILGRSEPFLGVLLEYQKDKIEPKTTPATSGAVKSGDARGVSFIGAGSYAQSHLLPNLPDGSKFPRRGVSTNSGTTSQRVADKFEFDFATDDPQKIIEDGETKTIFIATRHDSHAEFVLRSLQAKKHVYVEKPLCLNSQQLLDIDEAYHAANGESQLMVGFNRRFAPLAVEIKNQLSNSPMAVVYRVNAGAIPADSWIQDSDIGGGRIIGEVCHFIDLITYFTGSLPVQIYASALSDPKSLDDVVSVNIEFANGAIGVVHYLANGARDLPKEHVEVFQNGCTYVIDDFRRSTWYAKGGKPDVHKGMSQNKGQSEMMAAFTKSINNGGCPAISYEEIRAVTAATLAAVASIRNRAPVLLT